MSESHLTPPCDERNAAGPLPVDGVFLARRGVGCKVAAESGFPPSDALRPFVRRHPFFLFGLLTLSAFLALGALDAVGLSGIAAVAAIPVRLMVVPMYLGWVLVAAVERLLSASGWVVSGLAFVAGRAVCPRGLARRTLEMSMSAHRTLRCWLGALADGQALPYLALDTHGASDGIPTRSPDHVLR